MSNYISFWHYHMMYSSIYDHFMKSVYLDQSNNLSNYCLGALNLEELKLYTSIIIMFNQ